MENTMLTIGLALIFIVVLVGPFLNKKIESNLEAFLFVMGIISATLSSAWSLEVIHEGFVAPINITLAVLGAALTPLGEPLSTIVVSKLSSAPYHADFFYLAKLLTLYVLPAVISLGVAAICLVHEKAEDTEESLAAEEEEEKLSEVMVRAAKVYIFVMALIFLGAGFKPLIDTYLLKLPAQILFWVNMVSAILDNATLAAAEIGPSLSEAQIKSALLGLLISGGMLIPGNIPNIIAAHALRIKSTEWAKLGVPLGLVMMAATAAMLAFGWI